MKINVFKKTARVNESTVNRLNAEQLKQVVGGTDIREGGRTVGAAQVTEEKERGITINTSHVE